MTAGRSRSTVAGSAAFCNNSSPALHTAARRNMNSPESPSWTGAPTPLDEPERLRRLLRLGIGEGQHHEFLDTITALAAATIRSPISLVSLVEENRQFFLARHGLDASSTGRSESFCGHCVALRQPLVVDDAHADARFAGNPLVVGAPHVRAYLGMPLFAGPAQSAIGTLCIIDQQARRWTPEEQSHVARLATLVENYLENLTHRRVWDDSPLALVVLDGDGRCLRGNPAFARLVGRPLAALVEQPLSSCVLPADRGVLQAMLARAVGEREAPTRRELRFVRLGGEIVNGGTSMSPLREVDGQVVVVIRDISLERRMAARSGVVAEVRREFEEPIARSRALARGVADLAGPDRNAALAELDGHLGELAGMLDARIGDIGARVRVESELHASEQRLRSLVESVLGPLLVLDDHGRIVDANSASLAALGHRYDELVGASMRTACAAFTDATCRRWFELADANAGANAEHALPGAHATFRRRNGTELRVELRLMTMDWNGPGRLVVIARDVTAALAREESLTQERDDLEHQMRTSSIALSELRRMETVLKGNLEEKETLLKEIHHRVKNNLQMVASLLTLQMDQMPDERSRTLLAESVRRVRSMALIHQHLYGTVSLERVDLGAYARSLAETLRMTLAPSARLLVDADAVEVSVERAAPAGLLLNELLTNALKYGVDLRAPGAHPAGVDDDLDAWQVRIDLREHNGTISLVVRDRGPGLPDDFTLSGHPSLGLQLVTSLVRQLRGRVHARSDDGAVFQVDFPVG
jgi:PAS domain S-box-containing protein